MREYDARRQHGSRHFKNADAGRLYGLLRETNPYSDTGCLSVYAGTSLESAKQVVESVLKEFTDLKRHAPAEGKFGGPGWSSQGSLMLSLESASSRMSNLARQEMHFQRFFSLDELAESIEIVAAEATCSGVAQAFFDQKNVALTVLGNLDGLRIGQEDLVC